METKGSRISLPISGAILLGGKAKRLGGIAKEKLTWKGETFLQRLIGQLELLPLSRRFFSSSSAKAISRPHWHTVYDFFPDAGPMGGIASVLKVADSPVVFVPCDMPAIPSPVWHFLLKAFEGEDALFLENSKGEFTPTFGIYHPRLFPLLKKSIEQGKLSLRRFFQEHTSFIKLRLIPFAHWQDKDPERTTFWNINTWEDYRVLGEGPKATTRPFQGERKPG